MVELGNTTFFALSDALLAIPADLREHYTASPLLQALMQSRLGLTAETGLVAAERAIAAAAEPELSALLEIPDYLASQVEYGLAGHYYYWRALVRMERGEREAAQADAEIASSCGVIPNGSLLVQFMETQASRKTKESGSMSLVEQVKEIVANDPRVERDTGLIDAENSQSLVRSANSEYWRAIDGDHTLRLNYDLDNNSVRSELWIGRNKAPHVSHPSGFDPGMLAAIDSIRRGGPMDLLSSAGTSCNSVGPYSTLCQISWRWPATIIVPS